MVGEVVGWGWPAVAVPGISVDGLCSLEDFGSAIAVLTLSC